MPPPIVDFTLVDLIRGYASYYFGYGSWPLVADPKEEKRSEEIMKNDEHLKLGLHHDSLKNYSQALSHFLISAEAENPDGIYCVGKYYLSGIGTDKNPELAISFFMRAVTLGQVNAQYSLARIYYDGEHTLRDYKQAMHWFKEVVKKGPAPLSEYYLGLIYQNGFGVKKNLPEAFSWFKKSSDNGNGEADFYLATLYKNGIVVEKNLKRAFELYYLAAQKGVSTAQTNLAHCYLRGDGVEVNFDEAFKWFQKSGQSDPLAQNDLATCYFKGRGVEKDEALGLLWLEKAGKSDVSIALLNLGVVYKNGYGVKIDQHKSFQFFRRAAEKNMPIAQFNLAQALERGEGCDKDLNSAVYWYRQAYAHTSDENDHFNSEYSKKNIRTRIRAIMGGREAWSWHWAVLSENWHFLHGFFLVQTKLCIDGFNMIDIRLIEDDSELLEYLLNVANAIERRHITNISDELWSEVLQFRYALQNQTLYNLIKSYVTLDRLDQLGIDEVIMKIQEPNTQAMSYKHFSEIYPVIFDYWISGYERTDLANLNNLACILMDFCKPHLNKMTQEQMFRLASMILSTMTQYSVKLSYSFKYQINPDSIENLYEMFELNNWQDGCYIKAPPVLIQDLSDFFPSEMQRSLSTISYRGPQSNANMNIVAEDEARTSPRNDAKL